MLHSPIFLTPQKELQLAHTCKEKIETSEKYSLEWTVLTALFQLCISAGVKASTLTFKAAAPPQLTSLSVPKHYKDLGASLNQTHTLV